MYLDHDGFALMSLGPGAGHVHRREAAHAACVADSIPGAASRAVGSVAAKERRSRGCRSLVPENEQSAGSSDAPQRVSVFVDRMGWSRGERWQSFILSIR